MTLKFFFFLLKVIVLLVYLKKFAGVSFKIGRIRKVDRICRIVTKDELNFEKLI